MRMASQGSASLKGQKDKKVEALIGDEEVAESTEDDGYQMIFTENNAGQDQPRQSLNYSRNNKAGVAV